MVETTSDKEMEEFRRISQSSGIDIDIVIKAFRIRTECPKLKVVEHPPINIREETDIERPKRKLTPKTNGAPEKRAKLDPSYNLRKRASKCRTVDNKLEEANIRKDKKLGIIDVNNYHPLTYINEYAKEILQLYRFNLRTQLTAIVTSKSDLFFKTWLSTVRIFEYNERTKSYIEYKRLPRRYIKIKPNLITNVHISSKRIYIGHLMRKKRPDGLQDKAAYMEILDLNGEVQSGPYYYDHVIKSIESNEDFIFVITNKDVVYLHYKKNFHFRVFKINMQNITFDHVINLCAKFSTKLSHNSQLRLVTSTSRSIIISFFSLLGHKISQSFNFDETDGKGYCTVSTKFIDNYVIISRKLMQINQDKNSQATHRIILGYLHESKKTGLHFIHLASVCLECDVMQIECNQNLDVFILASTQHDCSKFALGCLSFKDFKPQWVMPIENVDLNSRFLVRENRVIINSDCQQDYCIDLSQLESGPPTCKQCKIELPNQLSTDHGSHPSLFRNIKIYSNKALTKLHTPGLQN